MSRRSGVGGAGTEGGGGKAPCGDDDMSCVAAVDAVISSHSTFESSKVYVRDVFIIAEVLKAVFSERQVRRYDT